MPSLPVRLPAAATPALLAIAGGGMVLALTALALPALVATANASPAAAGLGWVSLVGSLAAFAARAAASPGPGSGEANDNAPWPAESLARAPNHDSLGGQPSDDGERMDVQIGPS